MAYTSFFTESGTGIRPWRKFVMILGLLLVFGIWFGTRVYIFNHFQNAENPAVHPATRIFQEISVSMDEGHPLGEMNVSRFIRNREASPAQPYPKEAQNNDKYEMYKSLDPGYAVVFWAARHIFYFIPDTVMRPVMLQLFMDGVLLAALFFTFYRWGIAPAVVAGLIYSLSIVFAFAAATPWYHFWDGFASAFVFMELLWLYRLTREEDSSTLFKILLGCLIGITLGCAVWIRSSWFIFTPILLGAALLSRQLRPWLIPAILIYAIFASGMVWRSTELRDGELSYSTRMSWHTALQALGRHPNPYGLEDDDLYLLDRAYVEDGINYNLTDYKPEDQAMKKKYMALWDKDPGFIVQSIAQRMFSNVIFNFNDDHHPFWNYGFLACAVAGLFFGLWLGGEIGFISVLAALMFAVINMSYAFVYYITREYSYPTQIMLLFGNVAATAGVIELGRRLWRREWLNFKDPQIGPVNIAFIFFALLIVVVMIPPVQRYLTPNENISPNFESPDGLSEIFYMGLRAQVDNLSPEMRSKFLAYVRRETTEKSPGRDEPIFQYAMQHLRNVTFTNRDGHAGAFWMNKKTDNDSFQALTRASDSIAGVGYDWISGFDVKNPDSWQGGELRFKLLPNDQLPEEELNKLLTEKFAKWGWKLDKIGEDEYLAIHTGAGCSDIRRQLDQYFSHQCEDSHAQVH